MNERILELAREAAGAFLSYDEDGFRLSEKEAKKFAELIVKECSQFVEDKFDFCGDELIVAEQILKHFGIEE